MIAMDLEKPLSTADVPQEYWKDACLIGKVPFRASRLDQRASYCLYVPEQHYGLRPQAQLPWIIAVHGNDRDSETCRDLLIGLADRVGAAIMAPLFSAGLEDRNDLHNYKHLNYRGIRFDQILLEMVQEVKERWPAIKTEKFFLRGFSGGGQFVLKFMYLHPTKLIAVSIGAPGIVTQLSTTSPWPMGINGVEELFEGCSVDLDKLRGIHAVQLIVGGDDVQDVIGGFQHWIREKFRVNEDFGVVREIPNRKDALMMLYDQFISTGIKSELQVVPGVAHELSKLHFAIEEFLERQIKSLRVAHSV